MMKSKNAVKIPRRITGNNELVKAGIVRAMLNFEVAQMIYDARTKAGLSQGQLAALIGSKQLVIAWLEDADYKGYTLTMLQNIAAALDQRLEVRFVPACTQQSVRAKARASWSSRNSSTGPGCHLMRRQ